MLLENEIIKLRALEPEDIEFLYKLENNTQLWRVSNTVVPFSKYLLGKYLENSYKDIYEAKELRLIIDLKADKKSIPIGLIDIFDFDPYHKRAGIGIVIDKNFREKNYAFISLKLLIDYCFNYLNLHQLYCNITEDNIASINLFKKLNFEISAIKKDWIFSNKSFKNELFLQLINKTKGNYLG